MLTPSQLENFLQYPPEHSVVLDINSDIAELILSTRNLHNRPKKQLKIAKFAEAMSKDDWGVTGDTIKFGTNGHLLDGQNRLSAAVRAGAVFRTHVVFGIEPELFGQMDIGKPRNASDILSIAGYKYASTLASAVRWAYLLENDPRDRTTMEPKRILELLTDKYPKMETFIQYGRDANRLFKHPAGTVSALAYHFFESDPAEARKFFEAWFSGRTDGKNEVFRKLNEKITSVLNMNAGRMHELTRISLIIAAWNCYKAGSKGSAKAFHDAASPTGLQDWA